MPNPKPRPPRSQKTIDWGDLLLRYGGSLARLGTTGFVVCLAYFAYAIYGGALQSADPQRAYTLISLFGKGLVLFSFLAAAGFVIITLEEMAFAFLVAIGGLGLMLGIPYLVVSNLRGSIADELQPVVQTLSTSGTYAGFAVLLVVGVRVIYEIALQIQDAPARRKARLERELAEDEGILKKHKTITPPNAMSHCWDLPFCHDRIREICPAHKARRSCWRYGIGCNCDPRLIESLIRMGTPGAGVKQTSEMKARQGAYIRSDLEADIHTPDRAQRTIACAKCPIFNEHQRLKFKLVNPLAMGGTLVAMAGLYQPITEFWNTVAGGIIQVAQNITLRSSFNAGAWFEYLQDDVVKIFFFIIVSLIALSYVLKFTEWAVLEARKL
jgi:hypothetical protein